MSETLPSRADAVIVGAGVAGLTAAVRLADAGRRVVVFEERPRLGGRAATFTDAVTGERVDNGQHVLFGCYRETYALLQRIGTAHLAPLQRGLTLAMIDAAGHRYDLRCPPIRAPWHLAAGLLRWRALSIADRLRALRMRPLLEAARRHGPARAAADVPADETVDRWLVRSGQSAELRRWLWEPLAVAALNQPGAVASARPFARVVAELFGPRAEDSAVGLPAVPLDELIGEPARRLIESRGGHVRLRTTARIRRISAGNWGVGADHCEVAAPVVIIAVPWHAARRVWEGVPPDEMTPLVDRAIALGSSPIVTVNLWMDGPVLDVPFVGLVDGPMHWVFDKSAIFREPAGHLSIVASGADALLSSENAALTRIVIDQLTQALPRMHARTLVRSVVVREPRATFSLAPGGPARPGTRTPLAGVYLAGDWIDTGLPATIEGAAVSGTLAADAVLADSNRAGVGPGPIHGTPA
jgi:squalene-associated FAD-dependent desaturase